LSGGARLKQIDGLRGIAALSVMLGHWAELVGAQGAPAAWEEAIRRVFLEDFSFGRMGIVAFFCVSGFVIPFSFRGERPMIAFPISRVFRLYPAYWASILAAVVIFPLIGADVFGPLRIAANLTMIQVVLGQDHILEVYWTLFIEILFYAICYCLNGLGLLRERRTNLIALSGFVGLALIMGLVRWNDPDSNLSVGTPTYLAAMHLGTLARLRFLQADDPRAATTYRIGLLILLVGATVANTLAYHHAPNEILGWLAAVLGYLAGILLFVLCIERGWFGGSLLPFLGLISYSMYLFHAVVITVAAAFWPDAMGWLLATALTTPIYFALTIALAIPVHRWIERPGIRLGRSLEAAIDRRLDSRIS